MELNYIREFIVLSQVLQFQEAADILFIAQSSLSKHIKSIETELGHDLFVRSKKAIALTDFGKAWLPYATRIVNAQLDYTRDLLENDHDEKMITIGYIPMVTLYTFMPFFSEFKKKHSGYQYSFVQGDEKELLELLRQKKVDFILTGNYDFPEDQYQKFFYTSDSLCVILPEDHPLAARPELSLSDIQNETFIEFNNTESLIRTLEKADPLFRFNPSIKTDKLSVLFDLVQKNMGIAILTSNVGKNSLAENIVCRKIVPEISYEMNMVFPLKKASTVAREFAAYLKEK